MQRLTREVHDLWRDEVARAAAADARYRPLDTLARVRVLAPFRVAGGREAQPGEVVEVPRWLLSDMAGRGLAEQCDTPSATP